MDRNELMDNMIDLFNSQEWGLYELMEHLDYKQLEKIYYNLKALINNEVV